MEFLKYKNNAGIYALVPCSRFGMVIRALVYTLAITALIYAFAGQMPSLGFVAISAAIGFAGSFSIWMFKGFPDIRNKNTLWNEFISSDYKYICIALGMLSVVALYFFAETFIEAGLLKLVPALVFVLTIPTAVVIVAFLIYLVARNAK